MSLSVISKVYHTTISFLIQYSCLENPRDGGAWWAAVFGVTWSRTRLKRLSSSSSSSSRNSSERMQEEATPQGSPGKRARRGHLSYPIFSSVAQSCPTLCNPMDCSMPGLPVHHQANRWGNNRNCDRLYFLGLQNLCRW